MKVMQRGIQSVEVAGQILQAMVAQARPLTLKEIAELVDTPAAQVFTYLVSLARVGILKRNPNTQVFEPGSLSFRLGIAALHSLPKVRAAVPVSNALGHRLGLNVFLAVWSRHGPTVVHYIEHGMVLNIGFGLGDVMSLTRTATGRLFSAFQPRLLCEAVIRNQAFTRESLDTYRSRSFQQDLAEIRTQRLSIALGFPTPSVYAFSAPVFDAEGRLLLALSVFSSATSFDDGRIAEVTDTLRLAADGLSAQPCV